MFSGQGGLLYHNYTLSGQTTEKHFYYASLTLLATNFWQYDHKLNIPEILGGVFGPP